MNTQEQITRIPFYVFAVNFLQPTPHQPHEYQTFVYSKPIITYNQTSKTSEEKLYPQSVYYSLDDYYKLLEGKFTTKEEYLAWRAEWKAGYAELSKLIRHAKNNRKQNYTDKQYKQYEWAMRVVFGKRLAKKMLLLLLAAKDLSWQNKLKTKFKDVEVVAL